MMPMKDPRTWSSSLNCILFGAEQRAVADERVMRWEWESDGAWEEEGWGTLGECSCGRFWMVGGDMASIFVYFVVLNLVLKSVKE